MSGQALATALQRAEGVMRRRPSAGLHDDAPGMARWDGGVRIVASHLNGQQVVTDMPVELGGGGGVNVSPGWLVRAGLASCAAACIAMTAALEGVELTSLDVRVTSRSDTRGVLGMDDSDGVRVHSGPLDLEMNVRIAADGVAPDRLRAVVEEAQKRSPMAAMVHLATPMVLRIETGAG